MKHIAIKPMKALALASLVLFAASAHAQKFITAPVTLESVGKSTTVSGAVIPFKEVTLAAQIPGEINFLAGREGDEFESGAVLVAVDDGNIRAKRRAAVAAALAAESSLRNAQMQYNRELYSPRTGKPTGMGMPMMMDQMMQPFSGQYAGRNDPWMDRYANLYGQARGIEGARSQLVQAQASISELDEKLKDAQLKAPFQGVIIAKMVEKGDTVQPGQPLLKFAHIKFLRIQAEVPVKLVSSLHEGMMVAARLDVGAGIEAPARVAQIYPMADTSRHTVTVKFDLPQDVGGGPGMYAEVQLPDMSEQVQRLPTVPVGSVFRRGSLPAVWVLVNGKPSLRLVRVGGSADNGRVSILSGLKGDEQVIVGPPEKLATMKSGDAN